VVAILNLVVAECIGYCGACGATSGAVGGDGCSVLAQPIREVAKVMSISTKDRAVLNLFLNMINSFQVELDNVVLIAETGHVRQMGSLRGNRRERNRLVGCNINHM